MPAALSLLVASAECCALLERSARLRGVKAIHARAFPWRPGEGALARLAFSHRLALRAVARADAGRAGWPAWAVRMRMRLPRRHSRLPRARLWRTGGGGSDGATLSRHGTRQPASLMDWGDAPHPDGTC